MSNFFSKDAGIRINDVVNSNPSLRLQRNKGELDKKTGGRVKVDFFKVN